MTDQELRALVRDAVARHMGRTESQATLAAPFVSTEIAGPSEGRASHPSHAMYMTLINIGDACLIEPSVSCNHCGYCKTHGH